MAEIEIVKMLRPLIAILLIILSLTFSGCATGISGLRSYVNSNKGYEFLYPNGWISVNLGGARGAVDILYRDLVERNETLSVVINEVPEDKKLADLGTPTEVGYRLLKTAIAPEDSQRQADLLDAAAKETPQQDYYILEYAVKLPDGRERHNLASIAVSRGKLFSLNVSIPEDKWASLEDKMESVVESFSVY